MFEQEYLKARVKGSLHATDIISDLKALGNTISFSTIIETIEPDYKPTLLLCESKADYNSLDTTCDKHYTMFDERDAVLCCAPITDLCRDLVIAMDI